MNKDYTIYLKENQLHAFDNLDIYGYMNDDSTPSVFPLAEHAIFKYYLKRTPRVDVIPRLNRETRVDALEKDVLYICLGGNKVFTYLRNFFGSKSGKILYLENIPATLDPESTWKTIQTKRDLRTLKKIVFYFDHFAKLMYAYRAVKLYNVEIEDRTK